jgi:ribosomal protein S7
MSKSINKNFYRYTDGHFNSYWLGKLINRFMESGNLQTVEREFNKTCYSLKLNLKQPLLPTVLQAIEATKPTFLLRSKKVGAKTKEFPILINQVKRRNAAIKNIKFVCNSRKERSLNQRLLNELTALKNLKNHQLIKTRNENIKQAAINRLNIRFAFRKKR